MLLACVRCGRNSPRACTVMNERKLTACVTSKQTNFGLSMQDCLIFIGMASGDPDGGEKLFEELAASGEGIYSNFLSCLWTTSAGNGKIPSSWATARWPSRLRIKLRNSFTFGSTGFPGGRLIYTHI